jgi:hypothetical protein
LIASPYLLPLIIAIYYFHYFRQYAYVAAEITPDSQPLHLFSAPIAITPLADYCRHYAADIIAEMIRRLRRHYYAIADISPAPPLAPLITPAD